MLIDLILDAAGLLVRERPPGADGAPGPIAGDGVQATGDVRNYPRTALTAWDLLELRLEVA
jgi:hypothetical protein